MDDDQVITLILDGAFEVHKTLGPGLLESVCEEALAYELGARGLTVARQQPIPVTYKSLKFEQGFRADLIVDGRVIVELKSVETVGAVHRKQLLTYLRLTGLRFGLLLNFGAPLLKEGITRIANGF